MKPRNNYPKVSVDEFFNEMQENLVAFKENMLKLKMKPHSIPEWAEMLLAWMEVGTDCEEMCYSRDLPPILR